VLPPRFEQFEESSNEACQAIFFCGGGHRDDALLAKNKI
jgi:hypothetical protein